MGSGYLLAGFSVILLTGTPSAVFERALRSAASTSRDFSYSSTQDCSSSDRFSSVG